MHFFKGVVTAIYKNKEGQDKVTGRVYGGVFKMELSAYEAVQGGEGERPEHFEVTVPVHWGGSMDQLKDLLHQEIFFPYRRAARDNKAYYYVLDGAERPKPNHVVSIKLGQPSLSSGKAA
ncbi:MAG: hypothetical protein HZA02_02750 [Nitrospinae bacterium]|nr:hypothetical protein [Nitrospinota bacterium]